MQNLLALPVQVQVRPVRCKEHIAFFMKNRVDDVETSGKQTCAWSGSEGKRPTDFLGMVTRDQLPPSDDYLHAAMIVG